MEDFAKTIMDATAAGRAPVVAHGGIPYAVVPQGYTLQDLERLLPAPTQKRSEVVMLDSDSFIHYTSIHKIDGHSTMYADVDYETSKCELVVVLDDHGATTPRWRSHSAVFEPKLSIEWKRWTAKNKTPMSQALFAEFLEDNLPDVRSIDGSPSGIDILKMATEFEATSDKRFKKKLDIQTGGVAFEFVDQANAETSIKLQMFRSFHIGIPVFQGSKSAYPLEARLKFRQQGESLQFWYELIRHDRVFKTAVDEELAAIAEGTGLKVLYGTPISKLPNTRK